MKESQASLILEHMKMEPITALDALREYGCFRLASRITDLKDQGHLIASKRVRIKTRKGGFTSIAEYSLGEANA